MRLLTIVATAICLTGWGEAASAQRTGSPDDRPPDRKPVAAAASIRPGPGETVSEARFFANYGERLGLGPGDVMRRIGGGKSVISGLIFSRYVQMHEGARVVGGDYTLTLREGAVVVGFGRVIRGLTASTTPAIGAAEAMAAAKEHFAARLQSSAGDLNFTTERHELALESLDESYDPGTYALVHRCLLGTVAPIAEYAIVVDAASAGVVRARDLSAADWVPEPILTSGLSIYDGVVSFSTEKSDDDSHRLRQAKVETFDYTNGPYDPETQMPLLTGEADYLSPTNGFFAPEHLPGVGVHWGTERARQFFLEQFGADCLLETWVSPELERHRSYVNVEDVNAWWHPLEGVFHYGNLPAHFGSLGVVGHEFAHCISSRVGTWLGPSGEAAAIFESFSDIMSEMISFHFTGAIDWKLVIAGGVETRNFGAPHASEPPQPDYYGEQPFWLPVNDPEADHRNNSVHNRWFYLIATGSPGDFIAELGKLTAMRMAYASVVEKLTVSATYLSAANATDDVAVEMCGEFSRERVASHNAWFKLKVLPEQFLAYPYASPSDQAVGVDPWQAELRWQLGSTTLESAWDVRISPDPEFLNEVIALDNVSGTAMGPSNLPVGAADVSLEPGKTYYWTVRRHTDDPDLNCWRPVLSFSTENKTSTPITPADGHDVYHPWELKFKWTETDGAGAYDVEAYGTPDCSPGTVVASKHVLHHPMAFLDVRVEHVHGWRVRPVATYPGSWSACQTFTTVMPEVFRKSPADGSSPYPWGLRLEWEPIVGAKTYHVYLTHNREGFTADAEVQVIDVTAPKTSETIDLVPVMTVQGDKITWRVGVTGPDPLAEKGTDSTAGWFLNDGDATIPTAVAPMLPSSVDPPHIHYGADVKVTWQHVPLAESYRVSLYRFFGNSSDDYFVDYSTPSFSDVVTRDKADPLVQSLPISGANATMPPNGIGSQWSQYGFAYAIKAIGPGGLTSPDQHTSDVGAPHMNLGDGVYYLIPPAVTAEGEGFVYVDGKVYYPGGPDSRYVNLVATQDPKWSPTGKYVFRLYSGWGCDNDWLLETYFEDKPVTTTFHFKDYEKKGSYRAKIASGYQPFLNSWSACFDFQTVSEGQQDPASDPAPTDAPSVPTSLYGSLQAMVAIWTPVNNGKVYRVEVRSGSINGPIFSQGDFSNAQLQQAKNEMQEYLGGPLPGDMWFTVIPGTTPLTYYYFKVQGCNDGADDCGPWSDWSQWFESAPWPY